MKAGGAITFAKVLSARTCTSGGPRC